MQRGSSVGNVLGILPTAGEAVGSIVGILVGSTLGETLGT
jgi:TctA family transporter